MEVENRSFIDGCQVSQPTNILNKTKTKKEEKKKKSVRSRRRILNGHERGEYRGHSPAVPIRRLGLMPGSHLTGAHGNKRHNCSMGDGDDKLSFLRLTWSI